MKQARWTKHVKHLAAALAALVTIAGSRAAADEGPIAGIDAGVAAAFVSLKDRIDPGGAISLFGGYMFTDYVGLTSNPRARLEAHNAGLSPHTSVHRPWRTLVVIAFDNEEPAVLFERYLKTGSGREFARRHFRRTVTPPS